MNGSPAHPRGDSPVPGPSAPAPSAPDLSVVVPCRDAGELVVEAVDSVLEQRGDPLPELEVVVVNDRSSDAATLDALARLAERGGVRVVESRRSPGVAGARNAGVEQARGRWIAFLDADDLLLPDSIRRRCEAASEGDESTGFVAADFLEEGPDGRRRSRLFSLDGTESFREEARDALRRDAWLRFERPVELLAHAAIAWTGCVMARKNLIERVGGFREQLARADDTYMWLRLAAETDLLYLPRPLAIYRWYPESLSRRRGPRQIEDRRAIRLLMSEPAMGPYRGTLRRRMARLNRNLGWRYRSDGRRTRAALAGLRALRWGPGSIATWKFLAGTLAGRP